MGYTTKPGIVRRDSEKRAARRAEQDASRSTSPVWSLPTGVAVTLQFMSDPLDDDALDMFRETWCPEFKHVSGDWSEGPYAGKPRAEIPYGQRDIVVLDTVYDRKGDLEYLDADKIDVNGEQMNVLTDILDGSAVRYPDKSGNPAVSWQLLINAMVVSWEDTKNAEGKPKRHPGAGEHVLMKFRKGDWYGHIVPVLKSRRDKEHIDPLSAQWEFTVTGANRQTDTKRTIEVAKVGDAVPINVELFDADAEVTAQRDAFVALARAAHADMIGLGHNINVESDDPEEDDDLGTAQVDLMSTTALKEGLIKAGHELPDRISRAKLLAMYKKMLAEQPPF